MPAELNNAPFTQSAAIAEAFQNVHIISKPLTALKKQHLRVDLMQAIGDVFLS